MKYESHEELIGAYVDGELVPSEQIHVEQLLDQNPEYRQLYEELRTLRQSFAALPRYRLEEDLGPQILRRAEREMLVGAAQVEPEESEKVLLEIARADRPTFRPSRDRRVWLWPFVALAAALLITVANWLKSPPRVANNTGGSAPIGSIGAPPSPATEGEASRIESLAREPAGTSGQQRGRAVSPEGNEPRPQGNEIPLPLAEESEATAEKQPSERALATDESRNDRPGIEQPRGEGSRVAASTQKSAPSFAEAVLVVKCDVHADGVRNRTFQKLLADQQIIWQGLGPTGADATHAEPNALALPDAAVFVAATPTQVRNILFELMERTDEFASVETRVQPGVARQRVFAIYNRPNVAIQGSHDSIAKSGGPAGVNARALPEALGTEKPADATADKPSFEPEKPRKGSASAKPTKSAASKKPAAAHPASPAKSAAKPAAENQGPGADGEAETSPPADDARPLRVLFMFRLVGADGWPMTDSP